MALSFAVRYSGRVHRALSTTFALLLLAAAARGSVVLDWNEVIIDAIRVDNSGPTLSTRNLAILHTAIHDAVQSVEKTHQPYRFRLEAPAAARSDAAVVGAASRVLGILYPTVRADVDRVRGQYLTRHGTEPGVAEGLALGEAIADLALASRAADGSQTEVPYIPSDRPGQWRRTPPFFRPPLTPHWRYVRPFCLESVNDEVPPPPPPLDSPAYAEALNEVRVLGAKNSTVRTAEQTQTAVFWSDFSYTSMPPGHWHLIAADIVRSNPLPLAEEARLFALVSLAHADVAIVCWEAKYRYNLWRPITAIQRAGEDGNLATDADPAWDHLLAAPPFPAYTSGHSTFSKAAAEILARFYGTDSITFTATSDSLPGVTRTYHSLAACADEVGMSRIYGGIHFSFDNEAGKASGRRIGARVVSDFLLPEDQLPIARWESSANGVPRLRVHGRVDLPVELQASSDLLAWETVDRATARPGGVVLADRTASGHTCRFYRVRQP